MPPTVFPPHTRGWTGGGRIQGAALPVSPAHAGMDPWKTPHPSRSSCFPRTRGDGPPICHGSEPLGEFPPHTRGWTVCTGIVWTLSRVSPAHAGMDRSEEHAQVRERRFPRTRGDGPTYHPPCLMLLSFPPHTRGWTLTRCDMQLPPRVSPAHAGMDPLPQARTKTGRGFPRTRGDGPVGRSPSLVPAAFPPHTRGWTGCDPGSLPSGTVSPAHAGMDLESGRRRAWLGRFPRTRGDGPGGPRCRTLRRRFPPHTRGWTFEVVGMVALEDVSPAHAGMDRRRFQWRCRTRGFPRTRGDGPSRSSTRNGPRGFPPHTRGWTSLGGSGAHPLGVSPAHAGMDLQPERAVLPQHRFPRTRGDGPLVELDQNTEEWFPPHTRGWTVSLVVGDGKACVSPHCPPSGVHSNMCAILEGR